VNRSADVPVECIGCSGRRIGVVGGDADLAVGGSAMEQRSPMQPAQGVGARRSENLDAIMQSTLKLMLEQG
jgi:hypothetical protein